MCLICLLLILDYLNLLIFLDTPIFSINGICTIGYSTTQPNCISEIYINGIPKPDVIIKSAMVSSVNVQEGDTIWVDIKVENTKNVAVDSSNKGYVEVQVVGGNAKTLANSRLFSASATGAINPCQISEKQFVSVKQVYMTGNEKVN